MRLVKHTAHQKHTNSLLFTYFFSIEHVVVLHARKIPTKVCWICDFKIESLSYYSTIIWIILKNTFVISWTTDNHLWTSNPYKLWEVFLNCN